MADIEWKLKEPLNNVEKDSKKKGLIVKMRAT